MKHAVARYKRDIRMLHRAWKVANVLDWIWQFERIQCTAEDGDKASLLMSRTLKQAGLVEFRYSAIIGPINEIHVRRSIKGSCGSSTGSADLNSMKESSGKHWEDCRETSWSRGTAACSELPTSAAQKLQGTTPMAGSDLHTYLRRLRRSSKTSRQLWSDSRDAVINRQ